jgi:uncharacterized RDD family membrane protein YckC
LFTAMAARPPASEPGRPEITPEDPQRPQQSSNGTVGSLFESTARAGLSGALGVARRLGIDRAVDRSVDRALDSETAARATERFLDNETTKRVWDKVLASEEAQKLVERVADAPEVRAAITRQGVGLLEDLRRGVRSAARQVDSALERAARGILRRPQRQQRPIFAGAFSRLLAFAIDAGVVYGSLLLITAAIAALVNAFSSGDHNAGAALIAIGFSAWSVIAFAYLLIFWSGAGRTPGMSFVAIRMLSDDGQAVRPGQAFRRAIWLGISTLLLLIGFWGILFERERRGWPDRRAHTVVCYADPELDKELVAAPRPARRAARSPGSSGPAGP